MLCAGAFSFSGRGNFPQVRGLGVEGKENEVCQESETGGNLSNLVH